MAFFGGFSFLCTVFCVAESLAQADCRRALVIPQIALAKGVLTSSIGVRVRRFCGFVSGGLSGGQSSEVSSDVCVSVRVRRSREPVRQGVIGQIVV